jgi:SAM-dependent methyltransferase
VTDWDERYRRGEHASLEPHTLLIHAAEALAPGRALDLACGAGRHTVFLAERGWEVIAVDASRVAIETTLERARSRLLTIEARLADLERGEFIIEPVAFDLICDFYYLQRDLFPQIRAGLKPDGVFVAAIHLASENPSENQGHNPAFLLKPGELGSEFRNWEIIHYYETSSPDTDAGEHRRRSAEIIAKKSRPDG